jgi:hypothetical protein
MYLRHAIRTKDGKLHRYWCLVRSVRVGRRVIQQVVAHLGELDEQGRVQARALARRTSAGCGACTLYAGLSVCVSRLDAYGGLERQPTASRSREICTADNLRLEARECRVLTAKLGTGSPSPSAGRQRSAFAPSWRAPDRSGPAQ